MHGKFPQALLYLFNMQIFKHVQYNNKVINK